MRYLAQLYTQSHDRCASASLSYAVPQGHLLASTGECKPPESSQETQHRQATPCMLGAVCTVGIAPAIVPGKRERGRDARRALEDGSNRESGARCKHRRTATGRAPRNRGTTQANGWRLPKAHAARLDEAAKPRTAKRERPHPSGEALADARRKGAQQRLKLPCTAEVVRHGSEPSMGTNN